MELNVVKHHKTSLLYTHRPRHDWHFIHHGAVVANDKMQYNTIQYNTNQEQNIALLSTWDFYFCFTALKTAEQRISRTVRLLKDRKSEHVSKSTNTHTHIHPCIDIYIYIGHLQIG